MKDKFMNTPKNTKSEEIKQEVTKVGEMKDKKIDCTCKEHHKHECYFGKRPCDKCKGRNCTPQEQKSLLDSILSWEELRDEEEVTGKKLCDCDCNGPFCNDFVHQCLKSEEHYPQYDKARIEIINKERKQFRNRLEQELK